MRVVFEKPFGSDLFTATELATLLQDHLNEEEIYRVDHYMGKVGVQGIRDFRLAHKDSYDKLLNAGTVARVEVAMKETESCEGRTGFFDDYGTIRDVLQNHVTEMLALAMADLSPELGDASAQRIAFLRALEAPTLSQTVLGQYEGYAGHVQEDWAQWGARNHTRVETFASTRITHMSQRWQGVPIFLTAGKLMDERAAYVRFVFKQSPGAFMNEELVFNVQGPTGTAISATNKLPKMIGSAMVEGGGGGWTNHGSHLLKPTVAKPKKAYEVLLTAALQGDTKLFINTDELVAAWTLWTPLLQDMESNRIDAAAVLNGVGLYPAGQPVVLPQKAEKAAQAKEEL